MTLRATFRDELLAAAPGRVRFAEPMRLHTTFHLGGPAEVWAEPQDEEELRRLLGLAAEAEIPVTPVGGGANLLVRDEGIPGLVIHLGSPGFQACRREGDCLWAGAGLPIEWLVRRAQEEGLTGLEFLAGVPGRVGGAARMNAGTHDDEGVLHQFADGVRRIQRMDAQGRRQELRKEEAGFSYRASRLDGWIVLQVELSLAPEDPGKIQERVRRLWDFKKRTQDWSAPSVGCIFKNPAGPLPDGRKIPGAGWLVDQAGFKGRRLGGAAVSQRHANFILNSGSASSADVLALIQEIQTRVRDRLGISLETEVQTVPVHPSTGSG